MVARARPNAPPYLRLTSHLAMALDPVVMMQRCGLEPDPWQEGVLRSPSDRLLLNCTRQGGKSTTVGGLAMHTALFEDGSLTLLVSKAQKQSIELFRKCLDVYRALERPIPAKHQTLQYLELENGSRIVALPGRDPDSVRGYSKVRLLVFEEAAVTSDALYGTTRPMLAVSHGRLVLLSTPHGKRGFFYDAYLNRSAWDYFQISADECPRITKEFLEEERRTYGELYVRQEYFNEFIDLMGSAFSDEEIERAFTKKVETWDLLSDQNNQDDEDDESDL